MYFRYCPICGLKLRSKKQHGIRVPTCTNESCGFIFWQNSKPATVLIIENDEGEVLLTRRAIEPELGKLDWPGGFLLEGEDPREGGAREAMEELNVLVDVLNHVGVHIDSYGKNEVKVLCLCYTAVIVEGKPMACDEIDSVGWFAPDEIVRAKMAFASTPVFLDLWLQQRRDI